jgi:AcrR family transcriptional regulator
MVESNRPAGTPIWVRPEPATRQPRFSRDQIAAAAVAIADAEGFEAVSMRRIAAALGAGTMSLYRYIETKADLLALINDALLRDTLVPGDLPADWRDALVLVAQRTRSAYLPHPWAVQVLQGSAVTEAAVPGPNRLRHFEQSLAALESAPLDPAGKFDLLAIVDDYVFGHLLHAAEIAERTRAAAADEHAAQVAAEAAAEFGRSQLATGEFPRLSALAGEPGVDVIGGPDRQAERFERGLRLIIDGIAAQAAVG